MFDHGIKTRESGESRGAMLIASLIIHDFRRFLQILTCNMLFVLKGLIDSADLREAFNRMDEAQDEVQDVIDATNVRVDRKVTFDGMCHQ